MTYRDWSGPTSQSRLIDSNPGPIYIYYREIQEGKLKEKTITNSDRIRKFRKLIDGFDRISGINNLEDIDLNSNACMVLERIFENYPNVDEMNSTLLVNNFCEGMYTSARQEGKYAILVVLGDSVFICHAESREMTVTKDAHVIERLLDTDNVDKYAEFRNVDDSIKVRHFEKHRTKSLSGWLGVAPNKLTYGDAGKIQIFTEIDDATCAFQFTQDEFEELFLSNNEYEIVEDILRTPQNNEYHISQIKFGKRIFDNPDEFMQNFHSIYYDVKSYREHFENIAYSMEPYNATLYDEKDAVTEGKDGRALVGKEHDQFNILFVNKAIKFSGSWRVDLINKFEEGTTVRLFHAGMPFSEDPVKIGSFEIYNDLDLDNSDRVNKLCSVIYDAGTGQLFTNLLGYVIFTVLENWSKSPLSHLFKELANKYCSRLDVDGLILQDEDDILEYKRRDWFVSEDDEEIVDGLSKEIQGQTRLVIGGINEDRQTLEPIDRSKFPPERIESIRDGLLSKNGNHNSINVKPIPLRNGDCLLFTFGVRDSENWNLDILA